MILCRVSVRFNRFRDDVLGTMCRKCRPENGQLLVCFPSGARADRLSQAAERAVLAAEFDLIAILEDRQGSQSTGYVSILVDESWTDAIAPHDNTPFFENSQPLAL